MRIFLYLGVFFLSLVNFKRADEQAWWDDAQNYMEHRCKGKFYKLYRLQKLFNILAHRAGERGGDLIVEFKQPSAGV